MAVAGGAPDRAPHRAVVARAPAPDVPAHEFRFHFYANRPCLDLLSTIGERWRGAFERLRTPADLRSWVQQAGFADDVARVTAADLDDVRRLRAAIGRLVFAQIDGEPLPDPDLAVVNAAAGRPDLAPSLGRDALGRVPARATVSQVRSTLARDAIDLIASGEVDRVRECGADDCSVLFYDSSRPGTRRWCSMAGCGNRNKAAAHRRRHRPAR